MSTATDILSITPAALKSEDMYALQYCSDELYCKGLARVKYMFLSGEDYRAVCLQLKGWHAYHVYPKDAGKYYVMQVFGMYIAPCSDVPQSPEFAQARLTFEYLEYRLPALKKGEVITLC